MKEFLGWAPLKTVVCGVVVVLLFLTALTVFSGETNALQPSDYAYKQAIPANNNYQVIERVPPIAEKDLALELLPNYSNLYWTYIWFSPYSACGQDGKYCSACQTGAPAPAECALVGATVKGPSFCQHVEPIEFTQKICGLDGKCFNYTRKSFFLRDASYSWCYVTVRINDLQVNTTADKVSFKFTTGTKTKATVSITSSGFPVKQVGESIFAKEHALETVLSDGAYGYSLNACNELGYCNSSTGSFVISDPKIQSIEIITPTEGIQNVYVLQPITATYRVLGGFATYSVQVLLDGKVVETKACQNNQACSTTLPNLSGGQHQLKATASAGSENAEKAVSFTIAKSANKAQLKINGNAANTVIDYGAALLVQATADFGAPLLYLNASKISNPFNASLAAGDYNLTAVSVENENYSSESKTLFLTVKKASQQLTLSITPSNEITYGLLSIASCTSTIELVEPTLKRDNVITSNPELAVLAAGVYEYSCSIDGTENYSSATTPSQTLVINKEFVPVDLSINGQLLDTTLAYGAPLIVQSTASLLLDGVPVNSPFTEQLAVGHYNFTAFRPADQNYSYSSSTLFLTITKAQAQASLLINGVEDNASITYGDELSVIASTNASEAVLLLNGTLVANPFNSQLAAGSYNFTAVTPESENYSGSSKSLFVTVQKAQSPVQLKINNQENDAIIEYAQSLAVETNGQLFLDGAQVAAPFSTQLAAGVYNFTAVNAENENHSASTKTLFLTITKAPTQTYLTINGAAQNAAIVYGAQLLVETNGQLLLNGSSISSPFSSTLAAGYYNFTVVNYGNQNYSSSTVTHFLTITRAAPQLSISISPSGTVVYGAQTNANCTSSTAQVTPILKRDAAAVSNPEIKTLGAGVYQYSCTSAETQNYSSATIAPQTLTISKAPTTLTLYLNGSNADAQMQPGQTVNFTAVLSPAGAGGLGIYVNGSQYASGNSPLTNLSTFSLSGSYNATALFAGNQNYSASNATHWLTIKDTVVPSITFLAPTPENNVNLTTDEITVNVTTSKKATALLEVTYSNGTATNYSMLDLGGQQSFAFNATGLLNGSNSFKVYATDLSGNANSSSPRTVNVPAFVQVWSAPEPNVKALITFAVNGTNYLYAGTVNEQTPNQGGVYRSVDGKNWAKVLTANIYPTMRGVYSLGVYDDGLGNGSALYAGYGGNTTGDAQLGRTYNGVNFSYPYNSGNFYDTAYNTMYVWNGRLYLGASSYSPFEDGSLGGRISWYDGKAWSGPSWFGQPILSIHDYNSVLYFGDKGGYIFNRTSDQLFEPVHDFFGPDGAITVRALQPYEGNFLAGLTNLNATIYNSTNGHAYSVWNYFNEGGVYNLYVRPSDNLLYATTYRGANLGSVYLRNGNTFVYVFGVTSSRITSITTFNNRLYISTEANTTNGNGAVYKSTF